MGQQTVDAEIQTAMVKTTCGMDVGWIQLQPFNECRGDGDGWRWVDRTKVIGHV